MIPHSRSHMEVSLPFDLRPSTHMDRGLLMSQVSMGQGRDSGESKHAAAGERVPGKSVESLAWRAVLFKYRQ